MDLPHIDSYSLWLMLDDYSDAHCREMINELAEKYQSVAFQPHITLAGMPEWVEERIKNEVDRISDSISSFELPLKTVRCKNSPYQKLTIEVAESDKLNQIHQMIDAVFEGEYSKREYPHISFLYSTISCKNLQQERRKMDNYKPRKVVGNRIALVHCKGTPEKWRVLYRCKLNESKV